MVHANECVPCEWDIVSDPATKIQGPARECFRFPLPSPECEGVEPMCHEMVSPLTVDAAKRAIECLRSRPAQPPCEFQRVHKCVDRAIRKAVMRPDTVEACTQIVEHCRQKSMPLSVPDCRAYLSSMRYCEYLDAALSCLPDRCSLRACLGIE